MPQMGPMSRLNFALGSNDRVSVSLPSHRPGEALVRTGKAKLLVAGLSAAVDVAFEQAALDAFIAAVRTCEQTLDGTFALHSLDGSFVLDGAMAPHGHARVRVRLSRAIHRQLDDPQWELSAGFACAASDLSQLVRSVGSA